MRITCITEITGGKAGKMETSFPARISNHGRKIGWNPGLQQLFSAKIDLALFNLSADIGESKNLRKAGNYPKAE